MTALVGGPLSVGGLGTGPPTRLKSGPGQTNRRRWERNLLGEGKNTAESITAL